MPFLPDLRTSLSLALRARFFSFSLWLAVALVVSTAMAAQFSARQPATVALDVGLSTIRLGLPFLAALLLQELISREFDRKLFLHSLSYPRPRYVFLFGRIAAIALLLLALLTALATALAGVTVWISHGYAQTTAPSLGLPYFVTVSFIALDLFVALSIGTLISVVATTPSFVIIGTLGFMLAARSFSTIASLLAHDPTLVSNAQTYRSSLNLLGYLLPDLGALDVRMISLYGAMEFLPAGWQIRVGSTLAYSIALFALSAWTIDRKRFS